MAYRKKQDTGGQEIKIIEGWIEFIDAKAVWNVKHVAAPAREQLIYELAALPKSIRDSFFEFLRFKYMSDSDFIIQLEVDVGVANITSPEICRASLN